MSVHRFHTINSRCIRVPIREIEKETSHVDPDGAVDDVENFTKPGIELNMNDGGVTTLELYETASRFYLVGSNATQTSYRVLKIDRSEPKELDLSDDHVEYTEAQITNLINSLDQGNRSKNGKAGTRK